VEVTSYKNFTSDHHSIVTRVSTNSADLIWYEYIMDNLKQYMWCVENMAL
jgi:hypothetical protein